MLALIVCGWIENVLLWHMGSVLPTNSASHFDCGSFKYDESCLMQLYCFEDRGNRRVALRPELTPSLARLVIQKGYLMFCREIVDVFLTFSRPLRISLLLLIYSSYDFCIQVQMPEFDLHVFLCPENLHLFR